MPVMNVIGIVCGRRYNVCVYAHASHAKEHEAKYQHQDGPQLHAIMIAYRIGVCHWQFARPGKIVAKITQALNGWAPRR